MAIEAARTARAAAAEAEEAARLIKESRSLLNIFPAEDGDLDPRTAAREEEDKRLEAEAEARAAEAKAAEDEAAAAETKAAEARAAAAATIQVRVLPLQARRRWPVSTWAISCQRAVAELVRLAH